MEIKVNFLDKLRLEAKFDDFKIQNVVGSCDVKFPIRYIFCEPLLFSSILILLLFFVCSFFVPGWRGFPLSIPLFVHMSRSCFPVWCKQAFDFQKFSTPPHLFISSRYRMVQPKVVIIVFVSGKVVFTGA